MAQLTSEQLLTLLPETRSLLRAALGGAGDAPLNPGVSPVAEVLDGGGALRFPGLSARLALTLYDAHAEWASGLSDLEADQGFDATVRLYGLALAARAGGASPAEAAAWLRSPEGQRLTRYVTAVEIALAFSTDGDLPLDFRPSELVLTFGDDARDALSSAIGGLPADLGDTLRALLPTLDALALDASAESAGLADALRGALGPQPSNRREDLAAEAARWPVYRLLWPSGGVSSVAAVTAPAVTAPAVTAPPPPPPSRPKVNLARVNDLRDQLTLTLERREALARALDEAEAHLEALPSAPPPSEDRVPAERALSRARDARRMNQREVDAAVEGAWSAEGVLGEAEERLERALGRARRAAERRASLPSAQSAGADLQAERAAAVASQAELTEIQARVASTRAALRATTYAELSARRASQAALRGALETTTDTLSAARPPEVTAIDPGDSPAGQAEAAEAALNAARAQESAVTAELDVAEARLTTAARALQAATARAATLGERQAALGVNLETAQAAAATQRRTLSALREELTGLRGAAVHRRADVLERLRLAETSLLALRVPDISVASLGELAADPRPAWRSLSQRREAAAARLQAAEAAATSDADGGAPSRVEAEARRAAVALALGDAESRRARGLAALVDARVAAGRALADRRDQRARLAALLSDLDFALAQAPAARALAEAPPAPALDPTLQSRLQAARDAQAARIEALAAAEARLSAASARLVHAQAALAERPAAATLTESPLKAAEHSRAQAAEALRASQLAVNVLIGEAAAVEGKLRAARAEAAARAAKAEVARAELSGRRAARDGLQRALNAATGNLDRAEVALAAGADPRALRRRGVEQLQAIRAARGDADSAWSDIAGELPQRRAAAAAAEAALVERERAAAALLRRGEARRQVMLARLEALEEQRATLHAATTDAASARAAAQAAEQAVAAVRVAQAEHKERVSQRRATLRSALAVARSARPARVEALKAHEAELGRRAEAAQRHGARLMQAQLTLEQSTLLTDERRARRGSTLAEVQAARARLETLSAAGASAIQRHTDTATRAELARLTLAAAQIRARDLQQRLISAEAELVSLAPGAAEARAAHDAQAARVKGAQDALSDAEARLAEAVRVRDEHLARLQAARARAATTQEAIRQALLAQGALRALPDPLPEAPRAEARANLTAARAAFAEARARQAAAAAVVESAVARHAGFTARTEAYDAAVARRERAQLGLQRAEAALKETHFIRFNTRGPAFSEKKELKVREPAVEALRVSLAQRDAALVQARAKAGQESATKRLQIERLRSLRGEAIKRRDTLRAKLAEPTAALEFAVEAAQASAEAAAKARSALEQARRDAAAAESGLKAVEPARASALDALSGAEDHLAAAEHVLSRLNAGESAETLALRELLKHEADRLEAVLHITAERAELAEEARAEVSRHVLAAEQLQAAIGQVEAQINLNRSTSRGARPPPQDITLPPSRGQGPTAQRPPPPRVSGGGGDFELPPSRGQAPTQRPPPPRVSGGGDFELPPSRAQAPATQRPPPPSLFGDAERALSRSISADSARPPAPFGASSPSSPVVQSLPTTPSLTLPSQEPGEAPLTREAMLARRAVRFTTHEDAAEDPSGWGLSPEALRAARAARPAQPPATTPRWGPPTRAAAPTAPAIEAPRAVRQVRRARRLDSDPE